jgi:Protein of unknown function (DUF3551)
MMIILQSARDAMHFDRWQGPGEKSLAFFCVNGADVPGIPSRSFELEPKREEQDEKQFLKTTAAPASAMLALAFVAMTTPASAGEYCRTDVTSHMQSCGFDTLEQCQNMSSGRGGSCDRDPFLANTSSAYAYQAKPSHSKRPVQAAKQPVEGR